MEWLTVSRAARLVGAPRGELQRAIREGRLPANDGMVSTAGLLALYPGLVLEDAGAFERVAQVKEQAFGKRVFERALPAREVLAKRLFEQSRELADAHRHLARYHALIVALQAQLDEACGASPDAALRALRAAVDRGLADVLATATADPLAVMNDMLRVVSAHVMVRPSGREFFVEGRDTLLQAGLKSGLGFNYGCGNGTCGLCKARVIAGDVIKVAPHDYPLSAAERETGHVLLCCHSAASSEVVLETLEARGPQDIPLQELEVRVRAVKALAPDTLHLHVQTPRTNRLRFLAGQSVTLAWPDGDAGAGATLAVASCPCDERNLHFHVARDDADPFASALFAQPPAIGTPLHLAGPHGDFVLRESGRDLVFLACDTGFAPMKSLIEHAMAVDAAESMTIGWLATRADGHYLANQCRAWAESLDGFRYCGETHGDAAVGGAALVDAVAAEAALAQSDVYVSGPAAFVEAVATELLARGVPGDALHSSVA